MREIRCVKANMMFPVVEEIMEAGKSVRITVTGMSMYPFLRDKKDSVELVQPDFSKIQKGDILLFQRKDGQYILHRVIQRKKDCVYMNGDAQQWIEGPISKERIIAKVTAVWRNSRYISCSNTGWKMLVIIWRLCMPFRYSIINSYRRLRHYLLPQYTRRTLP